MGKNDKLINAMAELARKNRNAHIQGAAERITPQFYAVMAVVLHRRCGFGQKRLNDIFTDCKQLWEEYEGRGPELTELCENETGIKFVGLD